MAANAVAGALAAALKGMTLAPEDAATVALAKVYADGIDRGDEELSKLGPKLLDALMELGMTPRVRAAITKGAAPTVPGAGGLDELRARREKRASK